MVSTPVVPTEPVHPKVLAALLPPTTSAILLYGVDPSRFAEILVAARTLAAPLSSLPLIALYTSTDLPGILAAQTSVDDVFPSDGRAKDLVARLTLARRQVQSRADWEKAQAAERAKAETTLKQREEFLSVCAHDMRSPLGIIQASIGMILKQQGDRLTPVQTELLTRSKRQAAHAISLVHDLLDVMALEQGLKPKYEVIKLHDLLSDFHKDHRFQAEQKGIQFHYENPISDWRFLGDSDRVRQLFQNLVTNAIKFSEAGKNIYLKVTPFQGRRRTDPPYPMMVISLRDEGRGIPQDEMQKIFDRFTQIKTTQRSDGRGLGLTVAKQISNLHDGNIWVESEEGKGSTFFVLFPHVINRWTLPLANPATPTKILIAEPSYKRRDEYFNSLQKWGYTVVFAKDGIEALTMLYHVAPRILVLTPRLEKLEEDEVANIVKSNESTMGLPVLLATEKTDGEGTAPFDALLEVPFNRQSFENTVQSIGSRAKKAAA